MTERKVYDVSLTIYPSMQVWPGNPKVTVDVVKAIAWGGSSNISLLHIGAHKDSDSAPARVFLREV